MAKGKSKRSSSANEAVADGGASASDPQNTPNMPQIDESAFAGLRQKIEQRLKNEGPGKGKSKKDSKPQASAENTPAKKDKGAGPKAGRNQESAQGKKRDRNGDVIAREEKKGGEAKQSKPESSKKDNGNDTLRQEILALGGTEEDLDLLAGVDSESEVEGAPSKGKKGGEDDLRKELSKMLEAAGHVVPDDLEDEEAEQPEEEDNDEEAEDDVQVSEEDGEETSEAEEDSDMSEIEDAPPAKDSKTNATKSKEPQAVVPKEYAKLVSRAFLPRQRQQTDWTHPQAILPRSDWYNIPLPSIDSSKQMNALPRHLVERIHELANTLLQEETDRYAEAQEASASSSHKFYTTIMASGTLSDKISALTLAIQESPLHNTLSLQTLIGLGRKRSRAQAVEVLRSLKDMFAQGTLLPADRRLKSFANQPALVAAFQGAGGRWTERDPLPGGLQKSHLMVWAFEDYLKEQYFEVLKILETWCNDEIEFSRSRAVSYVYELLKEKPEQEANLLRLLVNKLGDPGKKIASRASYLLLQLEQQHPLMKPTIIKAVEELLFRPGQSQHAKYYAIITLNQTVLSVKEEKVAMQLLDVYFGLFVTFLKPSLSTKQAPGAKPQGKRGKGPNGKGRDQAAKGQAQDDEMREKLTSGVLTGVNRAYPFTNADSERYVYQHYARLVIILTDCLDSQNTSILYSVSHTRQTSTPAFRLCC